MDIREIFMSKIVANMKNKACNTTFFTKEEYEVIIGRMQILQKDEISRTPKDYRLMNNFEIFETQVDDLKESRLKKQGTNKQVVYFEELFEIIHAVHHSTGHSGKILMGHKLSEDYANITREHICIYLQLCEKCQLKKTKIRKTLVVKPIISDQLNSRCQVELIDMESQPDSKYKHIMSYQDHFTKFVSLRPLESKSAAEVAYNLLDIFCDKGAPSILHFDNGREFANQTVNEVVALWPDCRIVHGKPRHSQSQGLVEQENRSIEEILACWMLNNSSTKWSEGLRFVQWAINTRQNTGIGRTPYEAVFGIKPKLGVVSGNLPNEIISILETEEQLAEAFNDNSDPIQQISEEIDIAANAPSLPEQSEIIAIPYICVSCQQTSSGAHSCKSCGRACHAIPPCSIADETEKEVFGSDVLCKLCHQKNQIICHREGAKKLQRKQAEKMCEQSAKRFKPAAACSNK